MWELEHEEGWVLKNWCLQIVVLEETLESPSDCKEIKSVSPKGNQSWIFFGKTDVEAPRLWPPNVKSQLIGKDPDAGKDRKQKEKGVARIRWLDSITDSMDMNLSKLWERVDNRGAWHAAVHSVTESGLSNWTIKRNHVGLWSKKLFLIHIY